MGRLTMGNPIKGFPGGCKPPPRAAATTILAPSFGSRATGCAATIVATRKFRTYLPASTSKFWVQPFPKRLADSKGSAFGRFPQKAKSPY